MENLVSSTSTVQGMDYEAQVEQLLAEMEQLHYLMQSDRVEIEQLKEDSKMLKAETRLLLTSMGATL